MAEPQLRPATAADAEAINAIYNHEVLHGTATWQEQPEPLEARRRWLAAHGGPHPVLVAEDAGAVVAWGSLSPYHARSAWRFTVEDSLYVHHEHRRRGLGRLVLGALLAAARGAGHRSIVAAISGDQPASLGLHRALGFADAGCLRHAGFKHGRWLDCVYLQAEIG